MNIKACGLALLIISSPSIASDFPKLDEAYTYGTGSKDLRPVFDINPGCYPAAGISREGLQNGGLNNTGPIYGECQNDDFMDYSNTLHRYACITHTNSKDYCVHFYALYMEKDQGGQAMRGHRHDWEYSSMWTTNGIETHVGYSSHGDHTLKSWSKVPKLNGRAKIVYSKDRLSTHAFRFAKSSETKAQNPTGNWITPTITSWYELYGDGISNKAMRSHLNRFDYGSATIPMKDSNFLNNINNTRPDGYPVFTQESIEASNPYPEEPWENAIFHPDTGLCLDVWKGLAVGRRIITYTCKESDNQQFVYSASDKTIKVKDTDLCVEVYHGINANDQAVQTNLCYAGEPNQKWILDGFLIKSALSGTTRCMDRNTQDQINLWPCDRTNVNQQFEHSL